MEKNVAEVRNSEELRQGTRELADRAIEMANALLARTDEASAKTARGGRKAHRLEVERTEPAGG
jgi:hypothetical protein